MLNAWAISFANGQGGSSLEVTTILTPTQSSTAKIRLRVVGWRSTENTHSAQQNTTSHGGPQRAGMCWHGRGQGFKSPRFYQKTPSQGAFFLVSAPTSRGAGHHNLVVTRRPLISPPAGLAGHLSYVSVLAECLGAGFIFWPLGGLLPLALQLLNKGIPRKVHFWPQSFNRFSSHSQWEPDFLTMRDELGLIMLKISHWVWEVKMEPAPV